MDSRIKQLHAIMKEHTLDALFISSHENILYLTNYHGFSQEERAAYLFVTKKQLYLITDARYSDQTTEQIPNVKTLVRTSDTPTTKLLEKIIRKEKTTNVGFEDYDLKVAEYNVCKKIFAKMIAVDLTKLRLTKTHDEITSMQKACKLGDAAFLEVCTHIKRDVIEKELAYIIENYFRQHGAEPSFRSIVAFGSHAAIPHHMTSNSKLKENQCILMDFGAKVNGYCSDMTRTVFFGQPNKEFKKAYQTVLTSQQKAVEFLNSLFIIHDSSLHKINASSVDEVARKYILSQDFPSIPHSLGHGIGLAVHEAPYLSPKSKDRLENGMVFTIEPGIYLNNKFGIRIEDDYMIVDNKLQRLTKSTRKLSLF